MSLAYIKEHERLQDSQAHPLPVWKEPAAVEQTPVTFTTSTASAAFGSTTKFITFRVDADAHYAVALAPTATTSSFPVLVGEVITVAVRPGDKIAFIDA